MRQWEKELHTLIPTDLLGNPTLRIVDFEPVSLVDCMKIALEKYSGEECIRKPFSPPQRKLAGG